jgi:hypothetical protein
MKRELFGLILYTYDYYEWERVVCTSFDRELLVEKHRQINSEQNAMGYDIPLLDSIERESAKSREKSHYCIDPVVFLEEDQSVYRGDGLL